MVNVPVRKRGRPSGEIENVYTARRISLGESDDVRYGGVGH